MDSSTNTDRSRSDEHSWTEHVDTLLRWRRFLLLGIGVAWAILLVGGLLWPRTTIAEAMVALPNIAFAKPRELDPTEGTAERSPPKERDQEPKPGIPLGMYKQIEGALADERLLAEAFRGQLDTKTLAKVRRNLKQIVSPVTTGAREELVRADREDTVLAVKLSYEKRSAGEVSVVVNTLARLLREALSTLVAREKAEGALLQAIATAQTAQNRKLELSARNESLKLLAQELQRLSATGASPVTSGREVVDLKEGGHRYLPSAVQLVGARAWHADNEHEMRQLDSTLRVEGMRVAFYQRLGARLHGQGARGDITVVDDVPSVIDSELKAFLETESGAAAYYIRAEVEGLRDLVQAHRTSTAFVQRPSLRIAARLPWVVGGMLVAVIVILLAALLGESWRRHHEPAPLRA